MVFNRNVFSLAKLLYQQLKFRYRENLKLNANGRKVQGTSLQKEKLKKYRLQSTQYSE